MKEIIQDENFLRQRCEPVASIEEGLEIAEDLLLRLSAEENGIGLAANQIGIQKRVAVVNVKVPVVLINPEIIDRDQEIQFVEGCLSFPGKTVKTIRNIWVTVKSDNLGTVVFGPSHYYENITATDEDVIECVAVQHEIAHLDGLTMFDFAIKPADVDRKYGRNEKIIIQSPAGEIIKDIKYKKWEQLYKEKNWTIVNDIDEET